MNWTTVRVWRETHTLVKVLAAIMNVPLGKVIHDLVLDECVRRGIVIPPQVGGAE